MPGEAAQENAARIAREQAARAAAAAAALEQSRIVAAAQAAAVKAAQEAATVAAQKTATTYETEYAKSQSEYAQSQFDKYTTVVNENIVTIDSNLAQYHHIEKLNEWGKYDWSKYPGGKPQYIEDMEKQKNLRSKIVSDYKANSTLSKKPQQKTKEKITTYYTTPSGFKYPVTQTGQEAAFTEANKDLTAAIKSDKYVVTYTVNGKTEKKTFTTKQQADDFLGALPSAKADTSWIYTTPKGEQSTGGAKGLTILGVTFEDRSAMRGKELPKLDKVAENIGKIGEVYENIFKSVTKGAEVTAENLHGLSIATDVFRLPVKGAVAAFDAATFLIRPALWAGTANVVTALMTPEKGETTAEYNARIKEFVDGDIADPAERNKIADQLIATMPNTTISKSQIDDANALKEALGRSIMNDPAGFVAQLAGGVIGGYFISNAIQDLPKFKKFIKDSLLKNPTAAPSASEMDSFAEWANAEYPPDVVAANKAAFEANMLKFDAARSTEREIALAAKKWPTWWEDYQKQPQGVAYLMTGAPDEASTSLIDPSQWMVERDIRGAAESLIALPNESPFMTDAFLIRDLQSGDVAGYISAARAAELTGGNADLLRYLGVIRIGGVLFIVQPTSVVQLSRLSVDTLVTVIQNNTQLAAEAIIPQLSQETWQEVIQSLDLVTLQDLAQNHALDIPEIQEQIQEQIQEIETIQEPGTQPPEEDGKKFLLGKDKKKEKGEEHKKYSGEYTFTVTFTDYGGRVEAVSVKAKSFREAYVRARNIRRWHGLQHIVDIIRKGKT